MAGRHRGQRLQDAVDEWTQVDHAVRRRPDDQYAQAEAPQVLLVRETSIHAQQGIEMLVSPPQQRAVLRYRPTFGLQAADVVHGQLRRENPWQILVKQNAHGPE